MGDSIPKHPRSPHHKTEQPLLHTELHVCDTLGRVVSLHTAVGALRPLKGPHRTLRLGSGSPALNKATTDNYLVPTSNNTKLSIW